MFRRLLIKFSQNTTYRFDVSVLLAKKRMNLHNVCAVYYSDWPPVVHASTYERVCEICKRDVPGSNGLVVERQGSAHQAARQRGVRPGGFPLHQQTPARTEQKQ